MIPSVIASQVERGIKDFLRTTFPPSTPFFEGTLERLFEERDNLFKGPYISAKLPFRQGTLSRDFFESFTMKHTPFLHQERAFQRLTGESGQSTLISTGTGSGKTECFLYPILDHCYQHRGERGIKSLVIYPMNALANDQAKRIARLIAENDRLKGNVTAGLFVGQDPKGKGQMMMTDSMVITHKDTLRASPPDILLTNYKMLDYLLIRPVDFPLWKNNAPGTLRYLVVDEIHTFDGAQGTDLACLIRRLKARVKAPAGHVCCVGTSATLGGQDNTDELRRYAEQIFDESFDEDSVITENRLTPAEFLGTTSEVIHAQIGPDAARQLSPDQFTEWTSFIQQQYVFWFGEEVEDPSNRAWAIGLGKTLRQHAFFRNLIRVLGNEARSLKEVAAGLQKIDPELKDVELAFIERLVESLLALTSVAQRLPEEGEGSLPFLNVRIQVWMRELRRVVAEVERDPTLRFSDDLKPEQVENHLPLIHCRECGAMGWGVVKHKYDHAFAHDLQAFYRAFFGYSPTLHFVFPEALAKGPHQGFDHYICGHCLHAGIGEIPGSCPSCGAADALIQAHVLNDRVKTGNRVQGTHTCPFCESYESLTIVGSRSASLLSVVIGQLFNTTYYNNPQRKLLTFSDSVQDASHRAGFFEARTFRFSLRTAIQQVVQHEDTSLDLSELPDRFRVYWETKLDAPKYVSTFLAPDMAWFEDYESLRETGKIPRGSSLFEDAQKRIAWEILSEYGFRARIGRTLEKTGCSIVTPDHTRLSAAVERITDKLANEIGGWSGLEPTALAVFLLGMLTHMRTKGAIEGIAPSSYASRWGNYYAFNQISWMPNFGKHSRTPAFLTTKRGTRFESLLATGTSPTWYQDWLDRTLGAYNSNLSMYADAAYDIVLRALVSHGILHQEEGLSHPVWTLKPEALSVERRVDQLQCDHCGSSASAPESERESWEGLPCLRFRCPGKFRRRPAIDDYYGKLYSTGEVHRIFSGEHTGLLKREIREEIERRFIQQDLPASENLLSCTPTLEMGIDIGDLSSVLLCSIPPAQANYLQRIGRSGRQDGNAFNFAMAEGRPHDLYFFEEPIEMLAGCVEPPGVFLNAPAVLERQLVGYCFDRWVETGIGVDALPRKISRVLANLSRKGSEAHFPYNWFRFIDSNRTGLLAGFENLFDSLTEASKKSLHAFMEGTGEDEGNLSYRILNRLNGLLEERESLRRRVKQITRTIKSKKESKAKDKNTDEEIADLERDKASLNGIIRSITSKDTFNFFTDEGLLPNYAFPEAGVLLRSIIYRSKKTPDEHGKYDTRVFEYQRPAATAIDELAPTNTFYAEGRKVTIDRVNIELSEPEDWRFCDACSHAVREAQNVHKASCPKCGSPLWADEGQKRRMLRLTQVEATTRDWESRVDDASDSREPQFYCKHMLVEVDPAFIDKAFRIESDEVPFGFEFLSRADFREVNFGEQTIGEDLMVAGQLVPAQGFKICSACGRVDSEKGTFKHALTCRYHGKDSGKPLLDALYLYREFSSEAIRMLLPASSNLPTRLQSFVAAFYLGLQKLYKGSIEHLQTTIMEEPIAGRTSRKQYLVLYDRIPGGTGYLKDLMQSKVKVFDVLKEALSILTQCKCRTDPEKDGCYRCLYAYRNSRDMPEISRREAVAMLGEILEHRESVIPVDTVGDISINTLLESELETRFIETLRRAKPGGQPAQLERDIMRGKPGWRLKLERQSYAIVPQVELGVSEGVSIPSKADFVFYPEREDQGLPLAVFTDGFLYHADVEAGNLRVGEDLAQRMALVQSGRYLVWSLSWQDVESQFGKPSSTYFANYTGDSPATMNKLLDAYHDALGTKACSAFHKLNAFEALIEFLNTSDRAVWEVYAYLVAINAKKACIGYANDPWVEDAIAALESDIGWNQVALPEKPASSEGALYARVSVYKDEVDRPSMALIAAVPKEALKRPQERRSVKLTARLFDDPDIASNVTEFKRAWNGFLRLYNYMQFLPQARFVTTSGLIAGIYEALAQPADSSDSLGDDARDEIESLLMLTDPVVHDLIRAIAFAGMVLPEAGYELAGEHNEVVATAELAWPEARLAVLLDPTDSAVSTFGSRGWSLIRFDESPDLIQEVLNRLPA